MNCVYFLIPAIWQSRKNVQKMSILTYCRVVLTMFFQVIWVFGLTYASQRTIQSHAYLMNNVHGLFIVAINFIMGYKILVGECRGLLFALIGCILILSDNKSERVMTEFQESPFFANLINLSSAFFGALYFLLNAKNVTCMPICCLLFF